MALLITCTLLEQLWFLKCKKFLKQINCVHIDIFHQKGYRFKIRMEFLQPILVKIELIYQQPAMTRPTGVIWVVSPAMGCWIGWLGADTVIWIYKRWKTHWPIKKKNDFRNSRYVSVNFGQLRTHLTWVAIVITELVWDIHPMNIPGKFWKKKKNFMLSRRQALVIRTEGQTDAGNNNTSSALGLRGKNWLGNVRELICRDLSQHS